MINYKTVLILLSLAVITITSRAQGGKYLSVAGLLQYTQVANADDYFTPTRKVIPVSTFRPGAGISFINNFQDMFGFETGIFYSVKGQNYDGELEDTLGNIHPYESALSLTYLQAPLLFRFNSTLDGDFRDVYLCIKAGFQLGYLLNAKMDVNPPSEGNTGNNIPLKDLFKPLEFAFVASAIFNFRITDTWWINSGIRMERGSTDIENKNYQFETDTPPEYRFPVSSKHVDNFPREKANNNIFSLLVGISYRFPE